MTMSDVVHVDYDSVMCSSVQSLTFSDAVRYTEYDSVWYDALQSMIESNAAQYSL